MADTAEKLYYGIKVTGYFLGAAVIVFVGYEVYALGKSINEAFGTLADNFHNLSLDNFLGLNQPGTQNFPDCPSGQVAQHDASGWKCIAISAPGGGTTTTGPPGTYDVPDDPYHDVVTSKDGSFEIPSPF